MWPSEIRSLDRLHNEAQLVPIGSSLMADVQNPIRAPICAARGPPEPKS